MDSVPVELPPPQRIQEMKELSSNDVEVGKYYFYRDTTYGAYYFYKLVQITRKDDREIEFEEKYMCGVDPRREIPPMRWSIIPEHDPRRIRIIDKIRGEHKFYVPSMISMISQKAKVQAVKDVLAQKSIPEESSSGPLGTILGMAGIKQPPKQSGVGRRKTRKSKSKRSKKTRKH